MTSGSFDVDLRGLAAAADGTVLALGAVPGLPRSDGCPTTDMVTFRSEGGDTWVGPTTVARYSLPIALTSEGMGFLAIVNADSQLPNGSIVSESHVWRLDAGEDRIVESIPVSDEEPIDRVWVVGDVVVAGGYSLVDEVTNAMLLIWTDGGDTRGRVLYQDALGGRENELRGIVQIPGGLLGVGRRWDSASGHPFPEAWISLR